MSYKFQVALSFATEQQDLVDTIYHYLKSEGINVFFAPECQDILVGKNQREIFYQIFSNYAEYVVLFVSKDYIVKKIPVEEANIALLNHEDGHVITVYLDDSRLPVELLDPKKNNYYCSSNPVEITRIIKGAICSNARVYKNALSDDMAHFKENYFVTNGNMANNQQLIQNAVFYGNNKNS